jgi:hypothetical protein
MNEHDNLSNPDAATPQQDQVDAARRRITRGGAAGAGVLLSIASRSAFGTSTWGTCTGSELASGNLSREGSPRPCGCSPGFWGNSNGTSVWTNPDFIPLTYAQGQYFNQVFGVNFFKPAANNTLKNAIDKAVTVYDKSMSGGWCPTSKVNAMKTVAFHAVAALLNAQFYGSRYPVIGMQSPASVISEFQTAFGGGVNSLNAFKDRVDVYASGTWCNGAAG